VRGCHRRAWNPNFSAETSGSRLPATDCSLCTMQAVVWRQSDSAGGHWLRPGVLRTGGAAGKGRELQGTPPPPGLRFPPSSVQFRQVASSRASHFQQWLQREHSASLFSIAVVASRVEKLHGVDIVVRFAREQPSHAVYWLSRATFVVQQRSSVAPLDTIVRFSRDGVSVLAMPGNPRSPTEEQRDPHWTQLPNKMQASTAHQRARRLNISERQ